MNCSIHRSQSCVRHSTGPSKCQKQAWIFDKNEFDTNITALINMCMVFNITFFFETSPFYITSK